MQSVANSKKSKRSHARVMSSVVLLQQLAAAAPAMANGAFAPQMPAAHLNNFNHATAHSGSAATAWHTNHINAAIMSGFGNANLLPASFGIGVASLPVTHALPLAQASHFQHQQTNAALQHVSAAMAAANQAAQPAQVVQLDLTSASTTVVLSAGVFKHGSEATVTVGGNSVTYRVGDKVTAGELVAIEQAQSKGGQTIQLDGQGRASGGTFSLNSVASNSNGLNVASIVVPANVTAVDRVVANKSINLSGDLVNYGSIQEIGHGRGGSANINALDIVNETGASIIASGGGKNGLNLNLNAAQDFTNNGTISSSGGLTITAGGVLSNVAASSTTVPVLKAAGDVNLQAGTINNSGVVSSANGNVNLNASGDQQLNVNNAGGTISAANGAINVRSGEYAGISNTNVVGGDLLSQQVNLNAGGGTIDVDAEKISGTVNSSGNAVHVKAEKGDLNLGEQNLSGDPIFVSTTGDITIGGNVFVGEDLTYVAAGSIVATSALTNISANTASGQGANITMIAGANVTGADGVGASFDGASATGGSVDLSAASSSLYISSAATGGLLSGGNQTYAAFAGSSNAGQVLLPGGSTINAQGNGSGAAGNVLVLAPGNSTVGAVIGRNVQISSSQPSISGSGPVTYDGTGALTSTTVLARGNAAASGNLQVGQITSTGSVNIDGGNVSLNGPVSTAGGSLAVTAHGTILVYNSLSTSGGALTLVAQDDIKSAGAGTINISTSSNTGGGQILMVAGANFNTITPTQLSIFGQSDNGGVIDFATAPIASLTSAGGATGAKGGNITMVAFDSALEAGASGSVITPNSLFIKSGGGSVNDASGNVTVVAGNNSGTGTGIGTDTNKLSVDTSGGKAGTGNVFLSSSTADFGTNIGVNTNSASVSAGSFVTGALTLSPVKYGVISTNAAQGTVRQGSDLQVNLTSVLNTNMLFESGDSIATGSINSKMALALAAKGNILINGNISDSAGLMMVAGGDITVSGTGLFIDSSSTSKNGGSITMLAGADYTINGGTISINGSSATGGSVVLYVDSTDYVSLLNASSQTIGKTNGGAITIGAYLASDLSKGLILTGDNFIADSESNFGSGGDISILAGNAIGMGSVITSGAVTSTAGTIVLQTAAPLAKNLAFNLNGSLSSGAPVNPASADFSKGVGLIGAKALVANAGLVVVNAGGDVHIQAIDVSGQDNRGDGSAGGVFVSSGSSVDVLNLGGKSSNSNNYVTGIAAYSSANGTGAGGTISIVESGNAGITVLDANSLSNHPEGVTSTRGGNLTLDAGTGVLNLGAANNWLTSSILVSETAVGGTIAFTGSKITTTASQPIYLEAYGEQQAGSITVNITGAGDQKIGKGVGNFQIGLLGGGGSLSFTTPGNLSVDVSAIDGTGTSTSNYTGTNYKLVSGGNLLINGDLTWAHGGTSTGNGGSVYLQSASTTAFTVQGGSTTKVNGITGSISVAGTVPGDITIINDKGAIANKESLKNNFSNLTESGVEITFITGDIGGPLAQNISLTSHASTAFSLTNNIIANSVHLESNGKITASKVNTSNLTFRGFTDIAITNLNTGTLTIGPNNQDPDFQDNYGAKVTIKSAGSIVVGGQINVNSLDLSSSGKVGSGYTLKVNDAIFAYGTVNLQAPGNVTVNSSVTGSGGVTIDNTDVNAITTINASVSAGQNLKSGGDVSIGSTGNIVVGAALSGRTVDVISSAKSGGAVTIGGTITASSVALVSAHSSVTVNSEIDGNAGILVSASDVGAPITVNAPLVAVQGLNGGSVQLVAPGNISVTAAITGVKIGITSTGKVGTHTTVSISDSLNASGAVTISAPGNITLDSSITGNGAVTVTASDTGASITEYGSINGGLAGKITVLSKLGDINFTSTSSIDGGIGVSLTAPKGLINVNSIGQTVAPDKITIASVNRENLSGPIAFGSSLSAKVSGTGGLGTGDINIGGDIVSKAKTSTITLTAAATGSVNDDNYVSGGTLAPANIQAGTITLDGTRGIRLNNSYVIANTGNLSVSADNGAVLVGSPSYLASNNATLTITGLVDITINGQLQGCSALNIAASGKGTFGSVEIGSYAQILSSGENGKVSIIANGGGGISVGMHANVESTQALQLVANNSDLVTGVSSTIISDNSKINLTASNSLFSYGTTTAGTTIDLKASTPSASKSVYLYVGGDITAQNGYVNIVGQGSQVVIGTDTNVKAIGVGHTVGSILIEDGNTTKGNISTVSILGNVETSGQFGGNVTITVGTASKANVVTALPGFSVTQSGTGVISTGKVPSAIVIGTGTGADPSLTTKNASIILSSPTPANTITFYPGASVTADPPAPVAAPIVAASGSRVSGETSGSNLTPLVTLAGAMTPQTIVLSPTAITLDASQVATRTIAQALVVDNSNSDNQAVIYNLQSERTEEVSGDGVATPLQGFARMTASPATQWISETEIAGGKIPATLQKAAVGEQTLNQGSIVIAPRVDTTVKTPFGDVKVKANSLALIMAFGHGLGVYNLHDRSRNAVVITAGGVSIPVAPGKSAVVTSREVARFEHINPAQLVCYGESIEVALGNNLKAFTAEYSLPSMINAAPALRELLLSRESDSKKLADEFIKTTSILMQLNGRTSTFKQVLKPQVTACNQ